MSQTAYQVLDGSSRYRPNSTCHAGIEAQTDAQVNFDWILGPIFLAFLLTLVGALARKVASVGRQQVEKVNEAMAEENLPSGWREEPSTSRPAGPRTVNNFKS